MGGAGGREGGELWLACKMHKKFKIKIYKKEKKVGTYNSIMGLTVLKIQSEGKSFHLPFKNQL